MRRKRIVLCGCKTHRIVFDYDNSGGLETLSILIERHKSGNSGKLFKNPKWEADVLIDGKKDIKAIKEFMERLL